MNRFLQSFLLAGLPFVGGCGQTNSSKFEGSRTMQTTRTSKIDRASEQKRSHTRELDDSELPWGRPADWETEMPLAPGISY